MCLLKNKKWDLWVRPWSLTSSYNLDLEPFGRCNSEPLKKSKSSRSQIIFELSSIKNFAIITGTHLFWGLFLIKLQALRPAIFLKSGSNTGVSYGYCRLFKNSFFIEKKAASDSPTTVQWSQLGCFLFDFAPSCAIELDNFFLAWVILSSVFNFRICFGETSNAFDFDGKFTKSVAQIKMLYHLSKDFPRLHFALDQFQDMTWKWKNAV